MDLKQLSQVIRRRWISVVAVLAAALAASLAYSLTTTPLYSSTSRVFISTDVHSSADALAASLFTSSRVQSYASLVQSRPLLQSVVHRLHVKESPAQLGQQISATVEQDTVIIDLTVLDPSPKKAKRIADATATALASYIGTLERPVGTSRAPVKAAVVDSASVSNNPVVPRTWLNLVIGALIGLLLGVAVALVRETFDNRINSREELAALVPAPILAHLQKDDEVAKQPVPGKANANSSRSEAFRVLRSNLQFLDLDAPPKAIVITSAVPGEGKTTTAVNLAVSLAQTGQRVLLVDCDLRRPGVGPLLGLESAVGITTVLVGRATLEEAVQHHQQSGLDVLTSGKVPPNPAEVLESDTTNKLLQQLRTMYDMVVIDAPPLLPVADAGVLTRHADGAILVVRHGRTTRNEVTAACERLTGVGARLLGVVANLTPKRSSAGDYSYGYGYGATAR